MGLSVSLRVVAVAAAAVASACAVGPNFHRPAPPQDADYGSAPARGATAAAPGTGGNAQQFIGGMDIPGQWWELFQSPKLSALIEQALKGNPNIDAAHAAQLREQRAEQRPGEQPREGAQDDERRTHGVGCAR